MADLALGVGRGLRSLDQGRQVKLERADDMSSDGSQPIDWGKDTQPMPYDVDEGKSLTHCGDGLALPVLQLPLHSPAHIAAPWPTLANSRWRFPDSMPMLLR